MKVSQLFLLTVFGILADAAIAQPFLRASFQDILNVRQHVEKPRSIEQSFFSDQGAWHGYALPDKAEDYGGFIGPLIMDMRGQWLANSLCQLNVSADGSHFDLSQAKVTQHYYPGLLYQSYELKGLLIEQRLIFVSNRSARVNTRIRNQSTESKKVMVFFAGRVLMDASLQSTSSGVDIFPAKGENSFTIQFEELQQVEVSNKSYSTKPQEYSLESGASISLTQTQSFFLTRAEVKPPADQLMFDEELKQNEDRWNAYLNSYFSRTPKLSPDQQRLAVKSIVTLITNWRSAGKDLLHDGVFPSVNYQGFYGVWSWDSWKQASGIALFHSALAQDNIRCMFDYMDVYGMVADCIYSEKDENNWRDTKPPLAAWAVWNVYQQTKDDRFLKELYSMLVRYHAWWYANRDHDGNGLCEYGSTDGTRIAAAWESGMDNAVRFDSAMMMKNNDHAWSLNQESVDLNAYLYAEKLYLANIASQIKNTDHDRWKSEAEALKTLIQKSFFNKAKGYYYDKRLGSNELITIEGPEAWICLWAGIATPAQARAVKKRMMNTKNFNTLVPLPTLTAGHPMFDPMKGYWRGPVWLDQFYFGIEGLNRYGSKKEGTILSQKLFTHAEGLLTDGAICENYHPITGKCLNAKNFSWSAAHLLLLMRGTPTTP